MAIAAIDVTLSGASSNSYATVAGAIAYLEVRPGGKKFLDGDDDEKRGWMIFAAILIDRETFHGVRDTSTQALAFPRNNTAVIPEKIEHAQYEQALDLANGGYLRRRAVAELQSMGVSESRVEDTSTVMTGAHADAFPMWELSADARRLIQGFVETTVLLARS